MNLSILRHASAGTRRLNPLLDVKRPLDKEGKHHCLHLAHILNAMKVSYDFVVSSPLKRSLQTAQMVATETGYESKILISNALAPSATYAQFQRLLHEAAGHENVLVVGHNPNLTGFLSQLLGGASPEEEPTNPHIRLRKGTLARLTMDPKKARSVVTLQSLLDPRLVRAVYSTSTKSPRRKTSRK